MSVCTCTRMYVYLCKYMRLSMHICVKCKREREKGEEKGKVNSSAGLLTTVPYLVLYKGIEYCLLLMHGSNMNRVIVLTPEVDICIVL